MGELKVIGAGFGRTGTLSLKTALEQLGFGPVYHGEDIHFRPVQAFAWRKYYRTGTTNWDRIFTDRRSALDYPVCCAWRDLAEHYPNAKIILTVRDPQKWWTSTNETIYPAQDVLPAWWRRYEPMARAYVEFFDGLVWDGLFDGRFADREHAVKVFEQHVADVKATADPDRLLVFDVAEGWGPLCEFLGVAEPSHPFPHLNDTQKMKRLVTMMRVSSRVGPPLALAGAALGVARWRSFRRARA
jgi:hypothetical protein